MNSNMAEAFASWARTRCCAPKDPTRISMPVCTRPKGHAGDHVHADRFPDIAAYAWRDAAPVVIRWSNHVHH